MRGRADRGAEKNGLKNPPPWMRMRGRAGMGSGKGSGKNAGLNPPGTQAGVSFQIFFRMVSTFCPFS